jgi:hypothetical protein
MVAHTDPEPVAENPGVPRWRKELDRAIRPIALAWAMTLLTDSLPRPARIVVIVVVAIVYGFDRLDKNTRLARRLPYLMIYIAVGCFALAVTTPKAWSGTATLLAVVLMASATLITADRAVGLARLAGVSMITAGVYVITSAQLPAVLAGCLAIFLGLGVAAYGNTMFTRHNLRDHRLMWGRVSGLGLIGFFGSVQAAQVGSLPAAAMGFAASLSLFTVGAVLTFTADGDRQDMLAGALFAVCGFSVTGLGALAFHAEQYAVGFTLVALGIAVAGAGLSLLESTGVVHRLRQTYLSVS